MSIDYINLERPILAREIASWKPFIGYLSPQGDLIDFNYPFGETGHDGWQNIVTNAFLTYISFYIKGDVLIKGIDKGLGYIDEPNKREEKGKYCTGPYSTLSIRPLFNRV